MKAQENTVPSSALPKPQVPVYSSRLGSRQTPEMPGSLHRGGVMGMGCFITGWWVVVGLQWGGGGGLGSRWRVIGGSLGGLLRGFEYRVVQAVSNALSLVLPDVIDQDHEAAEGGGVATKAK